MRALCCPGLLCSWTLPGPPHEGAVVSPRLFALTTYGRGRPSHTGASLVLGTVDGGAGRVNAKGQPHSASAHVGLVAADSPGAGGRRAAQLSRLCPGTAVPGDSTQAAPLSPRLLFLKSAVRPRGWGSLCSLPVPRRRAPPGQALDGRTRVLLARALRVPSSTKPPSSPHPVFPHSSCLLLFFS